MATKGGARSRKRPFNVTVREDQIEQAKSFGTNVSAVLERALDDEFRERRQELWQAENRKAIDAWNDWVEENGIPFAELRPW